MEPLVTPRLVLEPITLPVVEATFAANRAAIEELVRRGIVRDPHLHDQLRAFIDIHGISEKVDRGGGFATARECQEVLSCSRKVHWLPHNRNPWNGFRTAMNAPVAS